MKDIRENIVKEREQKFNRIKNIVLDKCNLFLTAIWSRFRIFAFRSEYFSKITLVNIFLLLI